MSLTSYRTALSRADLMKSLLDYCNGYFRFVKYFRSGAPSRTRTGDLRICSPTQLPTVLPRLNTSTYVCMKMADRVNI